MRVLSDEAKTIRQAEVSQKHVEHKMVKIDIEIFDFMDVPSLEEVLRKHPPIPILLVESSLETKRTDYVPNWTHPKYNPLRPLTNGAAPALCQQDTDGVDEGD